MNRTKKVHAISKRAVRKFWSAHPLGSYESAHPPGSDRYFQDLDEIRSDSSRFAMNMYEFEGLSDRRVLDVGCGPGWILSQYSTHGARVTGTDLAESTVHLALTNLQRSGLGGQATVGDAESLPYKSAAFDFVCCDGVLHHTPGSDIAAGEIYRVLQPGGRALISVYYQSILLRQPWFFLAKAALGGLRVTMHGRPAVRLSTSRDEFVRWYDGIDNPVGKFYTRDQAALLSEAAGFEVIESEVHYFPLRFFPGQSLVPTWLYRMLDRWFGTMLFLKVVKAVGEDAEQ